MAGAIAVSMDEQSRKSAQHSTASAGDERDAKKPGDVIRCRPRSDVILWEIHAWRVSGDFAAERSAIPSATDKHAATASSTGTISKISIVSREALFNFASDTVTSHLY